MSAFFYEGEVYLSKKELGKAIVAFQGITDLHLDAYPDLRDRVHPWLDEARQFLTYIEGRQAETRRDWARAMEAYKLLPESFQDANKRLAYAEGRVAEAQEKWDEARDAYIRAGIKYLDNDNVENRRLYAQGRSAESAMNWEEAKEAYASLAPNERDVSQRSPYVRGQLAVIREEWREAFAELSSLRPDYENVQELLSRVCNQLYQQGIAAEQQDRWTDAMAAYKHLPDNFEDIKERRPYVQGRAAEQNQRWADAAHEYARLDESYQDVTLRLPDARARFAENEERWAEAVSELEGLPKDYRDVRERWYYNRGRAAEQDEDWPNVIYRFGGLPDSYRDGDVGKRRGYARARRAEAEGNWSGIVEALRDLPDEYRQGQIRGLRRYAQGRWAEEQGDWAGAAIAYQSLAEDYRDVRERRPYAQGRQAEQQEDWGGAVAAYELLAENYRDVAPRRSYARGRQAEQQEDWIGLAKAVQTLADGYRNVAQLRAYAQGRRAEEDEKWGEALRAYDTCGEYRDMPQRRAYVYGRQREAAGEWRYAIEVYRMLTEDYRDVGERQRRLVRLMEAVPWLDGLASAVLSADPLAIRHSAFPYEALKEAGITPTSSAEEIRNASFALMEMGAMTPEARLAWDQLRSLAGRLQVDAFLYRLQNVEGLRRLQQELTPGLETSLVQQLCQELPDDAPFFLMLRGDRERAVEAWEERMRRDPGDASVAHALAIAHFWHTQELETNGAYEQAETTWKRAIAYWTLVLIDDAYWATWWKGRADCYQQRVTQNDIARLRSHLGQQLLDSLSHRVDRYTAEGRLERAERYRELGLALEAELEGARALKEAGGLPLADNGNRKLACGPLYLRHMRLEAVLGRLVVQLEEKVVGREEQPDELVTILDRVLLSTNLEGQPSAINRLRSAFSELSKSGILLEHHQPERALRALPKIYQTKLSELPTDCNGHANLEDAHLRSCPLCQEFLCHNPAYLCLTHRYARLLQDAVELATRAHLAGAQTTLISGKDELDEALRGWEEAIKISRNAGAQIRTKRAVVRVVVGRADALAQERGRRRGERLAEAITLIECARQMIGGADEGQLRAKASEMFHPSRGMVWLRPQRIRGS